MQKRNQWGLLLDNMYSNSRCHYNAISQRISSRKKLKVEKGGYNVSDEEYQQVLDFWKPYNVKPKKYWYKLFGAGEGGFDVRYIPGDMWHSTILPYFNNLVWGRAYADKCSYDRLFSYLRRPRTITKNYCGRYFDGEERIITKEEAIQLCLKEERLIAKLSTHSSGGRSIQLFERGEVNEEVVRKIFDEYRTNFIVQEVLEQHEVLANLNPTSLNTLRVISFFFENETHILSAQLRIGGEGARLDNYSSSGFACNINPDGRLNERAIHKTGWVSTHPRGFKFRDIVVPGYDKVVKIIKEEAAKLPYTNIIGWDFAIGKDGEPVFIEMNVFPGQNQRGTGPTFGDMTERVLQDVLIDKSLKDAFI